MFGSSGSAADVKAFKALCDRHYQLNENPCAVNRILDCPLRGQLILGWLVDTVFQISLSVEGIGDPSSLVPFRSSLTALMASLCTTYIFGKIVDLSVAICTKSQTQTWKKTGNIVLFFFDYPLQCFSKYRLLSYGLERVQGGFHAIAGFWFLSVWQLQVYFFDIPFRKVIWIFYSGKN